MRCLDCKQILLTSSIRNIWRIARRICIFMSGLKGIIECGIILPMLAGNIVRVGPIVSPF